MLENLDLGLCHWLLALFILGILALYKSDRGLMDVPTIKYSRFLPTFFNRVIFYAVGSSLIDEGYEKVCLATYICFGKRAVLTTRLCIVQKRSVSHTQSRRRPDRVAGQVYRRAAKRSSV